MIQVLNANYFIDLDEIEKYLDMSQNYESGDSESGVTETKINIIKFEMVKMLLDTILNEHEIVDEKLGMKSNAQVSIPFKLAFNSLLNKKLINYY
jgi:GTP cyclohydrolase FolE2